jgi:hypothetical protein
MMQLADPVKQFSFLGQYQLLYANLYIGKLGIQNWSVKYQAVKDTVTK